MLRVLLLTGLAMLAFAANFILARLALGPGRMDAWSYTGVRLLAGAVTLAILVMIASRGRRVTIGGSWPGAAALFGYALAFSLAYLLLGAGMGALILFASVQFAMLTLGDRAG